MPTEPHVNLSRLSACLRTKRGKRGLREVAEEIGDVSASTLSRIEQENVPDVATFMRICAWLRMEPSEFMAETAEEKKRTSSGGKHLDTPEFIEAHLRADRVLPAETINALSEMIRLAYKAANEGLLGKAKK